MKLRRDLIGGFVLAGVAIWAVMAPLQLGPASTVRRLAAETE